MREYRRKGFNPLIVTLIIVLVMGVLSVGENAVLPSAFRAATRGIFTLSAKAVPADKPDYEALLTENELLKSENSALRSKLADYMDAEGENERLRRFYGIKKDNPSYELKPANVIMRDISDDFYSFTLDVGKSSGVAANDPVITENGLVGRVAQADEDTCVVKSILSPEVKVAAADSRSGDLGTVSGSVRLCSDNLTRLSGLSGENKVKRGDLIVTSGYGGVYPPKLIIGEVREVAFSADDASFYAVISPFDDIKTLKAAAVVTGFKGKGEVKKNSEN